MGRIRFGFSNLHYAVATEGAGGALTYGTPSAIRGAVNMNMTPAGNQFNESADNTTWYSGTTNDGYTGSIEFEDTAAADAFLEEVLGHTKATNGLVVEAANDEPKEFAIMAQFELKGGEESGKRAVFYRCIATRPDIGGETVETGSAPNIAHNVVNITALPRINDNKVKGSAVSTDTIYANFFTAVPEAA
jgi:phi13 family phage major tail protein